MVNINHAVEFRSKLFTSYWELAVPFIDTENVIERSFNDFFISGKTPNITLPTSKNGQIYKYHFKDKNIRLLIIVTPFGPVCVFDAKLNVISCGEFRAAFPNKFPLSFRKFITRNYCLTNDDLIRIIGLDIDYRPNIGEVLDDLIPIFKTI